MLREEQRELVESNKLGTCLTLSAQFVMAETVIGRYGTGRSKKLRKGRYDGQLSVVVAFLASECHLIQSDFVALVRVIMVRMANLRYLAEGVSGGRYHMRIRAGRRCVERA